MKVYTYILLLYKKLKGDLSATEREALREQMAASDDNSLSSDMEKIWDLSERYKDGFEPDIDAGLAKFKARIAEEQAIKQLSPKRKSRFSWMRIAAALLFLVAAVWVWNTYINDAINELVVTTEDNEQRKIELADGSSVVLNRNSTLHFPESFDGVSIRAVRLEGEAFFDIQPNPKKLFKIYTPESEVKVLGTSFNVRAYANESITEVEVVTGKVEFTSRDQLQKTFLEPNEKGIYPHGQKLKETLAKESNTHSWRTGLLQFRDAPLATVIGAIERHYAIQIDADPKLLECLLTNDFQDASLETVLETIQLNLGLEIKPQNTDTYQFSGGNCLSSAK